MQDYKKKTKSFVDYFSQIRERTRRVETVLPRIKTLVLVTGISA